METNNEWLNLVDNIPPDEVVEIIDKDGNRALGQPTYYPFEIIKFEGDERKAWGWRGTPVFYEDKINKWNGGWIIYNNLSERKIGIVICWRKYKEIK